MSYWVEYWGEVCSRFVPCEGVDKGDHTDCGSCHWSKRAHDVAKATWSDFVRYAAGHSELCGAAAAHNLSDVADDGVETEREARAAARVAGTDVHGLAKIKADWLCLLRERGIQPPADMAGQDTRNAEASAREAVARAYGTGARVEVNRGAGGGLIRVVDATGQRRAGWYWNEARTEAEEAEAWNTLKEIAEDAARAGSPRVVERGQSRIFVPTQEQRERDERSLFGRKLTDGLTEEQVIEVLSKKLEDAEARIEDLTQPISAY